VRDANRGRIGLLCPSPLHRTRLVTYRRYRARRQERCPREEVIALGDLPQGDGRRSRRPALGCVLHARVHILDSPAQVGPLRQSAVVDVINTIGVSAVVWRCLALLRVVRFGVSAVQRAFCGGFDSGQLHNRKR
jgi:hypothetical protein